MQVLAQTVLLSAQTHMQDRASPCTRLAQTVTRPAVQAPATMVERPAHAGRQRMLHIRQALVLVTFSLTHLIMPYNAAIKNMLSAAHFHILRCIWRYIMQAHQQRLARQYTNADLAVAVRARQQPPGRRHRHRRDCAAEVPQKERRLHRAGRRHGADAARRRRRRCCCGLCTALLACSGRGARRGAVPSLWQSVLLACGGRGGRCSAILCLRPCGSGCGRRSAPLVARCGACRGCRVGGRVRVRRSGHKHVAKLVSEERSAAVARERYCAYLLRRFPAAKNCSIGDSAGAAYPREVSLRSQGGSTHQVCRRRHVAVSQAREHLSSPPTSSRRPPGSNFRSLTAAVCSMAATTARVLSFNHT